MIRHFFAAFAAVTVFSLAVSGCRTASLASPEPSEYQPAGRLRILTIGTADSGGTMYPVGKAIAQAISQRQAGSPQLPACFFLHGAGQSPGQTVSKNRLYLRRLPCYDKSSFALRSV